MKDWKTKNGMLFQRIVSDYYLDTQFKVKMINMVEEVELGWLKIKESFTPFHSRYG